MPASFSRGNDFLGNGEWLMWRAVGGNESILKRGEEDSIFVLLELGLLIARKNEHREWNGHSFGRIDN